MIAHPVTLRQTEALPESYPAVDGVTGDMLEMCWQRIEHYIARRYSPREVVWLVASPGCEWNPPLGPIVDIEVEVPNDPPWTPPVGWAGGYALPSGMVKVTATVGAGSVPASVEAAVQRLAAYLEAESAVPAGARSYRADVGQLSESISADPAHMAKALQNSGAADLLRPYRKAI